jgi:hypothetical protein
MGRSLETMQLADVDLNALPSDLSLLVEDGACDITGCSGELDVCLLDTSFPRTPDLCKLFGCIAAAIYCRSETWTAGREADSLRPTRPRRASSATKHVGRVGIRLTG